MNGKTRILVVDYDEDIRFIVAPILEKMGYEVVGVRSGPDAIRAAASKRFHLALVDIKIPDIGERSAIRQMRKLNPRLPLILITDSLHSASAKLREATQEFLYKPLRPAQLKLTIERVLGGAGQEEP